MVDWGAMDYANRLGQAEGEPLYKGIVRLVRNLIAEGALAEGDALPAQRDFAAMAKISRGTVSLAYDELRRDGIITAVPGRGSVISSSRYVNSGSRKEQAIRLLSVALDKLEGLGFSAWEIEAFIHLLMQERAGQGVQVKALLVDCNPEALGLIEQQFASVPRLALETLILEDFMLMEPGEAFLQSFDLFLTTEHHAPHVSGHLTRLQMAADRCVSLAVSPGSETLVAMARIPQDASVVVLAQSRRFAEIIQQYLIGLGHSHLQMGVIGQNPAHLKVMDETRWVVPQGMNMEDLLALGLPPSAWEKNLVIPFRYLVDRGSILRVEETVTTLLLQKGEGILASR